MEKLVTWRETAAHYITQPAVRLLVKTAITPNTVTWMGFILSLAAAALAATGQLLAAGIVVLVAGLLDILDGALARQTQQATPFGALLDSTIDRISESVLLLGIMVFYARAGSFYGILLAGATIPSSLLVSYIRARAEALSVDCKVGIFTRAERVIILALGLLLGQFNYVLLIALGVITFFSLFTVVQRLVHAQSRIKSR